MFRYTVLSVLALCLIAFLSTGSHALEAAKDVGGGGEETEANGWRRRVGARGRSEPVDS